MKTKTIFLFILILVITACVSAGDTTKTIEVYENYFGMYSFPMDMETWEVIALPPRVIRNQEEFIAFKESIPQYEMTKKNPPPESNDPLLTLETIDWSSKMMLVIFSFDPNTFIDIEILNVHIKEGKMQATAQYVIPDPMEIHQKIVDYGLYAALVVDRFEGEVVFNREDVQQEL